MLAKGSGSETGQLRARLQGRWRQAARALMVLLSLHGLPPSQIAGLPDCHPVTVRRWIGRGDPAHDQAAAGIMAQLTGLPRRPVVLAEDETHLNLLPHVRARTSGIPLRELDR